MKIKDICFIMNKLNDNGFGNNEVDSMETNDKEDFIFLCLRGIYKTEFMNLFDENPLKDSSAKVLGFNMCEDIYITEKLEDM